MSGIVPVTGPATGGPGHDRRAGGGATPVEHGRRRSQTDWQRVLDELEDDVLQAEVSLAPGRGSGSGSGIAAWGRRAQDWVPPGNVGPLPDHLRERAARLLQRQLAAAEALVERVTQSQRQRDVAARMSHTPSRPVPSFVDRGL